MKREREREREREYISSQHERTNRKKNTPLYLIGEKIDFHFIL